MGFISGLSMTWAVGFHEAESAAEGLETSDGRSGGGDRPAGARQEEVAERAGRAAGGQRAAAEPAQRPAQRDQVSGQTRRGKSVCSRSPNAAFCASPGGRAALPRCSTPCTTTKRTTTSAPTGRPISAHRRPTSARPARRTSSPPSLCEVGSQTAALTLSKSVSSCSINVSKLSIDRRPTVLSRFIQTNVYIVYFDKSTFPYFVSRSALGGFFLINKLITPTHH